MKTVKKGCWGRFDFLKEGKPKQPQEIPFYAQITRDPRVILLVLGREVPEDHLAVWSMAVLVIVIVVVWLIVIVVGVPRGATYD